MADSVETAWRILQIIALSLPAYAILLQVLVRLMPSSYGETARKYLVSFEAFMLLVPMALAGVVTTWVIYNSISNDLIRIAVALISISFIFTPFILLITWRRNMQFFDAEYPEARLKLSEKSDKFSHNYPRFSLIFYIFGMGIGIYFLILSWGIWFNILGTVQVVLSALMIVITLAPDIDIQSVESDM